MSHGGGVQPLRAQWLFVPGHPSCVCGGESGEGQTAEAAPPMLRKRRLLFRRVKGRVHATT
eukprot:10679252-Prorocentrum_lima.AAC.1